MWRTSLCLLMIGISVRAAELNVGPGKAFPTVKAGIAALKDGDTLTIAPGKYYETVDVRKKLKNVTIRAEFPGSVLIHGDKPAPQFSLVPGYRFIYAADWTENVNAVNERDTLRIYLPAATVRDLEFNFGQWFKKDGKLYISTSDGLPPDKHDLTVSVLNGCGLRLWDPEKVTVEGLVFTGFYSHFRTEIWSGYNGIQLQNPDNCAIRDCTAFLNANGISLSGGKNSLVENCVAYANGSLAPTSGGNIIGWSGTGNTIRGCVSMFRFPAGSNQTIGLRFYGTMKDCNIENCVSFGEGGLNIKGKVENSWLKDSYSEQGINALYSRNNVFGGSFNGYNPKDVSPLKEIKKEDWPKLYADPENHDFRPVSKVVIGKLDNLKNGDTVLLPPGEYPELKIEADNVTVRTRGAGASAVVKGGAVTGKNVRLENLVFSAPITLSGDNLSAHSCVFEAKATASGRNLRVTHCQFKTLPDFSKATGYRHSNLGLSEKIAGLSDLDDGRSFDAFPPGPYRLIRSAPPARVTGPFLRSVTDTVADIEWWTDAADATTELCWGTTEKCENRIGQPFSGGNWHSMSLTGLKPGTKYYFRLSSRSPLREHHSNMDLAVENRQMKRSLITTQAMSFNTLGEKPVPRTLTVAEGIISDTLDKARPGDTVVVQGGVYPETLYFRSAGVTLKNAPGEKVWIDGQRILSRGIVLENKPDTVIDGLFFRELAGTSGAGIQINGGVNITVRRCFYDGRSQGYTPPFLVANSVRNLTVDNCFITRGFSGSIFLRCPNLMIRNCVWFNNQIQHFYIHNLPDEAATFARNVIFDNIPMKNRNPLIRCLNIESLKEHMNCYCLRVPEENRKLIAYHRIEGDQVNGEANYEKFLAESGRKRTSFFANPGVKALPQILTFKHPELLKQSNLLLNHDYDKEALELQKQSPAAEEKWNGKSYEPWDFSVFFATNPECVKNHVGLNPELFQNGAAK
ncbi:MAG: hypothetical protein BWY31_02990 [Lentisphaerae bacterium ADurb.Bin242]|nr:MAG: hypothetical protein BWY31_02990 [Lentisphaerae bacterium ADurb.Bin242]